MKFRKKPVVIEAFPFVFPMTGNMPEWLYAAMQIGEVTLLHEGSTTYLTIKTLEGRMRADLGDWIIQGVKKEIYPCKPDIFAATYDPAE